MFHGDGTFSTAAQLKPIKFNPPEKCGWALVDLARGKDASDRQTELLRVEAFLVIDVRGTPCTALH